MTLRIERAGPVTVLTLDRPEARNAVDAATALRLADAIDEFGADDDARVLILTGAGAPTTPRRAKEIGLVREFVPAGQALSRAMSLAQEMAAYPQASLWADRA